MNGTKTVSPSSSQPSFLSDAWAYACQVRLFTRTDWFVYVAWVGLMLGLLVTVAGFVFVGWSHGVRYPEYVWSVPLGTAIFIGAIAFDTIGHRTAYKEELKKGEALVHHITIFCGIISIVLLSMCYDHRELLRYPAATLILVSIFYSVIDEGLHWHRYLNGHSDRIEMWSHAFIFIGHLLMVLSWWHWYEEGYPGVAETFKALAGG